MVFDARGLTFREQVSGNSAFKGRPLAVRVRGAEVTENRAREILKRLPDLLDTRGVQVSFFTPLGTSLSYKDVVGKTIAEIDRIAAKKDASLSEEIKQQVIVQRMFDEVIKPSNSEGGKGRSKIDVAEMTDNPRLPFRIVNVLFKGVSILDGRALAQEVNKHNPGRKLRLPTFEEAIEIRSQSQINGGRGYYSETDEWILTESTNNGEFFGKHKRCPLTGFGVGFSSPETRDEKNMVILIEDKRKKIENDKH